jgi:hypothetical protein
MTDFQFRLNPPGREFCRGALEAGWPVQVFHADVAADCLTAAWADGPGDLWRDRKHPPIQLGV